MSGNAPLAMQILTTLAIGATMVVAGLGKRRLVRRPSPKISWHHRLLRRR
jgi:hypothetical protein